MVAGLFGAQSPGSPPVAVPRQGPYGSPAPAPNIPPPPGPPRPEAESRPGRRGPRSAGPALAAGLRERGREGLAAAGHRKVREESSKWAGRRDGLPRAFRRATRFGGPLRGRVAARRPADLRRRRVRTTLPRRPRAPVWLLGVVVRGGASARETGGAGTTSPRVQRGSRGAEGLNRGSPAGGWAVSAAAGAGGGDGWGRGTGREAELARGRWGRCPRGNDGQGGGDCADRPEAGQDGDQEERGEGRGPPGPRDPRPAESAEPPSGLGTPPEGQDETPPRRRLGTRGGARRWPRPLPWASPARHPGIHSGGRDPAWTLPRGATCFGLGTQLLG